MSRLSLLQGVFPTQGSNPGLPHCRRILYQPKPFTTEALINKITIFKCVKLSGIKYTHIIVHPPSIHPYNSVHFVELNIC